MDNFNEILGTSTIHGLYHVSTTKSYLKMFWTLIVFSGFITSGILIDQSFKTWSENPIVTTIETVPIENVTFPNVTVCPPKNTYTNLNYDLKMIENITMNNVTRRNFIYYALSLIQDHHYSLRPP